MLVKPRIPNLKKNNTKQNKTQKKKKQQQQQKILTLSRQVAKSKGE